MNTVRTLQINSTSSERTERLAAKLGARLRGGEVIELVSDLGGGKTTFTRGMVRGAGSGDNVASPTFTISREYVAPRFTITHFDFYRLDQAGIVADELAEIVDDPKRVTIVEWGNVVHDVLPADRLRLTLRLISENERQLGFEYPDSLAYLIEDLT